MKKHIPLSLLMAASLLLVFTVRTHAFNEMSVKTEYDSNVNRGITQQQGDFYLGFQFLTEKPQDGESRLEWVYSAYFQAAGYKKFNGLNFIELAVSPGLVYHPYLSVTAELRPFIQVRGVSDPDQSAITAGALVTFGEQVSRSIHFSQYYAYRQIFARDDTYSSGTHSAGFVGTFSIMNRLVGEASYDFSYGDSYRSLGKGRSHRDSQDCGDGLCRYGQGNQGHYNPTFGQMVIREKVSRHTAGAAFQYDLGRSWFCTLKYYYSSWNGDSGISTSNIVSVSAGIRF